MSEKPSGAAFDFGRWPGMEFLKGLAQPGAKALPGMGQWVAPTLSVEELDKRIQELKTVLFWLEQNATALKATVQAMEVQRMTLATLQNMNVSMTEMAQAFSVPVTPPAPAASKGQAAAAAPAPEPKAPRSRKAAAPAAGVVDPMQWWGALTQQFQTIADQALKDTQARAPEVPGMQAAKGLAEQAIKTTEAWAGAVGQAVKAPAKSATRSAAAKRNAAPARKSAERKGAARQTPTPSPRRSR